MANPITNLDPVLPPFRDGIQDQNDKLNALYEFFEQGPFNAVPTSGGTMTGPLHLQVPLEVSSGGTGAQNAADGRTNLGAAAAVDLAALGAAIGTALAGKEPTIPTGTLTQYVAGDKTLRTFFADVRAATMTAVSFAVSSAVVATDTLLAAIGKLQAQNTVTINRIGDAGGLTFRNRITNGGMLVRQRPAQNSTPGVTGYSNIDRYRQVNTSGTGLTIAQASNSFIYNGLTRPTVRQVVAVAATNFSGGELFSGISQNIEGICCYDLKTKPIAISFIFNASVAGTYNIALRDSTNAYSYVSSFTVAANTPTPIQLKIPVMPGAASISSDNTTGLSLFIGCQASGTSRTSTLNSWIVGNFLTGVGQTLWATTLNAFIEVAELQLEAGTACTEFEVVPYTIELRRCRRYFQQISTSFQSSTHAASTYTSQQIYYDGNVRISPSISRTTSSIANCTLYAPEEIYGSSYRFTVLSTVAGTCTVNGITVFVDADF